MSAVEETTCPGCGHITRKKRLSSGPYNAALDPIYSRNPVSKNRVRILKISPGSFDDTVVCELESYDANEIPKYIALSYCWGSSHLRGDIIVSSVMVSVTK